MTLEVDSVSVLHAGRALIRQVSLTLHPGEVVGVVGPNGAGKSTLLRVMLGLMAPSEGQVLLHGVPLDRHSILSRAKVVAAVLQSEVVVFPLKVADLVALGRRPHLAESLRLGASDRRAVHDALVATDAVALGDRDVTQLSGGETKRVLLARALAQLGTFLLLDEPTAGLDAAHQLLLAKTIRGLALERQVGVLWVLHDLNLALHSCDRICVLKEGRQAFVGAAGKAFSPALIRDVFALRAEELTDSRGHKHIVFRDTWEDKLP